MWESRRAKGAGKSRSPRSYPRRCGEVVHSRRTLRSWERSSFLQLAIAVASRLRFCAILSFQKGRRVAGGLNRTQSWPCQKQPFMDTTARMNTTARHARARRISSGAVSRARILITGTSLHCAALAAAGRAALPRLLAGLASNPHVSPIRSACAVARSYEEPHRRIGPTHGSGRAEVLRSPGSPTRPHDRTTGQSDAQARRPYRQ